MTRFPTRYLATLRTHLKQDTGVDLQAAHKLGDDALNIGLETLDLAKIHEQAVASLSSRDRPSMTHDEMSSRAASFFAEAIIPIENKHRLALAANADLNQLTAELTRRTQELSDSTRNLKRRVSQRETLEKSLMTSGDRSATLLEGSRCLQKQLQDLAHRIVSVQESAHTKLSRQLQDKIAQTLLGINVRLQALKENVRTSNEDLKKEIATTQRLVRKTVKTIDRFAREFGISHEE